MCGGYVAQSSPGAWRDGSCSRLLFGFALRIYYLAWYYSRYQIPGSGDTQKTGKTPVDIRCANVHRKRASHGGELGDHFVWEWLGTPMPMKAATIPMGPVLSACLHDDRFRVRTRHPEFPEVDTPGKSFQPDSEPHKSAWVPRTLEMGRPSNLDHLSGAGRIDWRPLPRQDPPLPLACKLAAD